MNIQGLQLIKYTLKVPWFLKRKNTCLFCPGFYIPYVFFKRVWGFGTGDRWEVFARASWPRGQPLVAKKLEQGLERGVEKRPTLVYSGLGGAEGAGGAGGEGGGGRGGEGAGGEGGEGGGWRGGRGLGGREGGESPNKPFFFCPNKALFEAWGSLLLPLPPPQTPLFLYLDPAFGFPSKRAI